MKRIKYISILLLCVTTMYAQPGQPETSSFTPIGQTDLVNLSTNPDSTSWLPGFISDRWLWSVVPWLIIGSWIALYVIKSDM